MSKEHSFKEGQEVATIWLDDDTFISIESDNVITGCDKITVVMECGHGSEVPWFALWEDGKMVSKHNAAFVRSVVLKNE